jgi:hypothetical protein
MDQTHIVWMLMESMQTSLLEEMEKTKVFEANEHH